MGAANAPRSVPDRRTKRGTNAMLAPLNESDWVLRQYTGSSDTWATVTPMVLPGSDDGKFAKAEKLFFKAPGGQALYAAGGGSDAIDQALAKTPGRPPRRPAAN